MRITISDAPHFSDTEAVRAAAELFGIDAAASPLPSERDQNFRLRGRGRDFVLKIANATELRAVLELQCDAIEHIASRSRAVAVPAIHRARNGDRIATLVNVAGRTHFVRLLDWVPGVCLANVRPHSPLLLRSLGRTLAEMDRALLDFSHPAMRRPLAWDLAQAGLAAGSAGRIADPDRRAAAARIFERFQRDVAPALASTRTSVIHADWNDYNVLVSLPARADREVVGAIDFGDVLWSHTICDLAIALTYAMFGKHDPIAAAARIVGGYHEVLPLTEPEIALLYDLVLCRLAISMTMAACQGEVAPDRDYLQISQTPAARLLAQLEATPPAWAECVFRDACGLPAYRRTAAVTAWLRRYGADAAPVVAPDPRTSPSVVIDLSAASADIGPGEVGDKDRFSKVLEAKLKDAGGLLAVGRYDEARLVYTSDLFQRATDDGPEWRTVHLGIDLFAEAGTPVFTPFDAVVHSLRDNAGALDYGPTIVLRHALDDPDASFCTLYGHLARASLDGLRPGQSLRRGERIGAIGSQSENGGWLPHLHFQIVADMLGRDGEFPGVAAPSQRRIWLSLSPDPNLVLGIPADRFPPARMRGDEVLAKRTHSLGPNLSVSYRRPLTIVRGWRQHLYDEDGRAFLDGVNNVAHVGHSHPRVVGAAAAQMAILNTNTRYLHEHLVRYAERLLETLPEPLRVCYFVCSGSEANELALRLARAHTHGSGIVVLGGAYHGNTSALVEISPYKFDGPGGAGRAAHVQVACMPDPYRGPYRGSGAGPKYARHVAEAVAALDASGHRPAAFIAEPLLSCGGQIVLPDGYLAEAYRIVRTAGAVCIADEVQVGFGRVGSHFWGFDTQGVVPDIVTLGKPIGNGHPLGAVVTTREIAASFANGMEYFNTFGGNPVSCAVGLAVLDVMRDEGLQAHARDVGARLRHGLSALMVRHPIVGDVRGLGLFIGVEFVADRDTRQPAPAQAAYAVERLRDRGLLLSTDGPDRNVIKIKPPMVFTAADADRLVEQLDEVLQEDPARID
jgi:4-aminobutyrate aminotransferase-like enzyme/Ser/Thr protein kinase RdoA (MazF antagonist)/murein DD-endopeptidase MepM/ murein hydrolase activator NlpD